MNTLIRLIAMLLILIVCVRPSLASSPALTTGSTTADATPTSAVSVIVVVDVLNLRAGPDTNHPILERLSRNTQLLVFGRSQDGTWLAVLAGERKGWVATRYVQPISPSATALTPATPTPTPTATPAPPRQNTVVLDPGTSWPVRADQILGWGYEFVDASQGYDWVLHRDVYGQVAHAFWGAKLYDRHPHGIRITLIDPVWEEGCPSPVAPVPLVAGSRCLLEGFGDGAGAMVYAGCAVASDHFYDPQSCYIAIAADGPHVGDAVLAATITAQNMLVAGYAGRTPDLARYPFNPLLGEAYRDGDQWRWRQPYLEVLRMP